MKKWIVILMLCLLGLLAQTSRGGEDPNNCFALTFMTQQNESAFNIRGSYRHGLLEPFLGSEIRFDSDPEVFDIGCLVHSGDVVEPNAVPFISPTLTKIFNDDLVLTGYSGFHTTININNKGSYFGSILGVSLKDKPASPLSIVGEIHFNDIGNTSDLDEADISETPIYVGMKYDIKKEKENTVITAYAGRNTIGLSLMKRF